MLNMPKKILKIFLILVLIKSFIWMILTPIFQVPDEPSHFSIIQFIVQNGQRPHPRRQRVSSEEILAVSQIVNFNWEIHHPVWQGYTDDWKNKINSLDKNLSSIFKKNPYQTSLKRPPLYYWLSSVFYFPFKSAPFLFRFYLTRFLSIIISLVVVYLTYLITYRLFRQLWLSIAIAGLVAFQPLFSFITISIHYDPLTILTTTLFFYGLVSYLQTKQSFWRHLSLAAALLGVLTRPDLLVLLLFYPVVLPKKARQAALLLALAIIISLTAAFPLVSQAINQNHWLAGRLLYTFNLNDYTTSLYSLFKYFSSNSIITKLSQYFLMAKQSHLVQIFPWYWGVFGWLESTLPLWVYKLLKLSILVSILGWLKLIVTRRSSLKLSASAKQSILFFFLFSLAHFIVVVLNDFIPFANSGKAFGIQGRYLLPAIVLHLTVLALGWYQLINQKYHQPLSQLIFLLALSLNLVGLHSLYQYFGWIW